MASHTTPMISHGLPSNTCPLSELNANFKQIKAFDVVPLRRRNEGCEHDLNTCGPFLHRAVESALVSAGVVWSLRWKSRV